MLAHINFRDMLHVSTDNYEIIIYNTFGIRHISTTTKDIDWTLKFNFEISESIGFNQMWQ